MTVSCYTLLIRYTYGKEHKQGEIMEIYSIKDEKFRRYGKVWSGFDCTRLIREMEHTPLPEDVIYVPDAFTYDTSRVEAFFVPAGTVVEMYGTTLHYAPCNDGEEGFKCIVILPKGTNTEIDFALPKSGEDALMTAKNKWLIAHEEAGIRGAFNGLLGVNIEV